MAGQPQQPGWSGPTGALINEAARPENRYARVCSRRAASAMEPDIDG